MNSPTTENVCTNLLDLAEEICAKAGYEVGPIIGDDNNPAPQPSDDSVEAESDI